MTAAQTSVVCFAGGHSGFADDVDAAVVALDVGVAALPFESWSQATAPRATKISKRAGHVTIPMRSINRCGIIYRRGNIWWCWYYDANGARIRRSTGASDKKAARVRLADWERQAADPTAQEPQSLNDCLQTLIEERQASTSEANVRFIEEKVRPLVTILGHDLPISAIRDTTTGRRYIEARRRLSARKKPPSDRTIERELEVLAMSLRLAKSHGRWAGDLDNIIPPDFHPSPPAKGDTITRREALKLFPKLTPNTAAAMAFALATGAERSALRRALRSDIPSELVDCVKIIVRGTKNEARYDDVPVVTDEQRILLAYAREHGQGADGMLFAPLDNFWRDLNLACLDMAVTSVSAHDLRRSAGQWMIDIGVPLEIVSRFLRHRDIATTQRWYAEIRDEDLADRLLDAIDPRLATKAHAARDKRRRAPVETIEQVPTPKEVHAQYTVDGVTRTLDAWAAASGIPKTTLYYRVVTMGSSMADALALGRAKLTRRSSNSHRTIERCDTGVTVSMDSAAPNGANDLPRFSDLPRKSRENGYARCDSNTRHSASKADALSS